MSRNYQMYEMKREEEDRYDLLDRAFERREAIALENERIKLNALKLEAMNAIDRPLSSCEIAGLRSRGYDV